MNRVATAGLISGLYVVMAACSSGDSDGILSMNPGVGASGSGGSLSQLPTGTAGTTSSGSTAPAPTGAGTTGGPTAGTMMPNPMMPMAGSDAQPSCGDCKISPECQGFPLMGLKYSPGGTTLPNKCMPFHPTLNNPYAVRCIDVIPEFNTGFPGDEFCILPPPPDQGMQIGLHPQGNAEKYWAQIWAGDYSGYTNAPAEWVMEPGDETTQNYRGRAPLTENKNYYRTYFRMRTGSHHNIITMHDSEEVDGWIPKSFGADALPGMFDSSSGASLGVLGGQQRPDDSTPVTLEAPPEDKGLYLVFPANASVIYNMHHFNFTDKTIVREGWSNIWWQPEATVKASWYMGLEFSQLLALSVPAGQTMDFHYQWNVTQDVRLLRVFGHRHFWTPNFSTWIERAGGETELIYQSYDWADMPTYRYDSVVQNPPLNPEAKTDGATSGVTMLHSGDQLHFNCHITFTDQHSTSDADAPTASEVGTLRFANEVYTGEMCIQFGNVTGGSLGLPGVSSSPLPDFAKMVK